jgi:hypothetical protein
LHKFPCRSQTRYIRRAASGFIHHERTHHEIHCDDLCHWVQVGADYVLIAIATGIIVSIVLGY